MSTLIIDIPDSVRAALDLVARREHKSIEQVAIESLTRIIQAQQLLDYLAERSQHGRREDFDNLLDKVPGAPSAPDQKL